MFKQGIVTFNHIKIFLLLIIPVIVLIAYVDLRKTNTTRAQKCVEICEPMPVAACGTLDFASSRVYAVCRLSSGMSTTNDVVLGLDRGEYEPLESFEPVESIDFDNKNLVDM